MILMRALSSTELLSVWERGVNLGPFARAELLLRAACDPQSDPDPSSLSLGERDSRLLSLREWTFGPQITGITRCPKCRDEIELSFQVLDLRIPSAEIQDDLTLTFEEFQIRFRLPTCADLATMSQGNAAEASVLRRLIAQCVSSVKHGNESVEPESLPDAVLDALSARMSELDPQAETELALSCESCGVRWNALFDVESFFWSEIQAWATRLFQEVHELAASYGWSESAILSMTPLRRSLYLNLITG